MPVRARPVLLLDLDGTLVDPARGMLGCYRHALAKFGVFPADTEDLRWVIGPPIRETFRQWLDGHGDAEEAVRLYRERYLKWGLYEAVVYPGVSTRPRSPPAAATTAPPARGTITGPTTTPPSCSTRTATTWKRSIAVLDPGLGIETQVEDRRAVGNPA